MKSKCRRCGRCCVRVGIGYSPKQLKQAYLAWRYGEEPKMLKRHRVEHVQKIEEIWLIYPMLRFHSKRKKARHWYYYTCKHFTRDKNGKGRCEIYDVRPGMCSGFPYYDSRADVRIGQAVEGPSGYKDCGYNK